MIYNNLLIQKITFMNKKKLLAIGKIIQVYTEQVNMQSTKLSKNFVNKIKKFENI